MLFFGLYLCQEPKGFCVSKITSDSCLDKSDQHQKEAFSSYQHILSQKFTYLSSGAQCYAFISEDQKYVIKFFRIKYLTPKYWLSYIPIPWLDRLRFEKIDMRERRRKETYDSFRLVMEDFKEETALLFTHFSKTHYPHDKVILVDKLGVKHIVSLNKVPFVLQKKAEMIYPYVSTLIREGKRELALESLINVLLLIKERSLKGYVDKDGGVSSNYGFIDGRPVEIDLGRVVRDDSIKDPVNYLQEILRVSKKIESWLQLSYPELTEEFQERVQRILS